MKSTHSDFRDQQDQLQVRPTDKLEPANGLGFSGGKGHRVITTVLSPSAASILWEDETEIEE